MGRSEKKKKKMETKIDVIRTERVNEAICFAHVFYTLSFR